MGYKYETDTTNSKQFRCPNCGSNNIDYGHGHLEDEYYIYYFDCCDCGASGREYNQLVFDGYMYNVENDTED